jgi:hypothetical protein
MPTFTIEQVMAARALLGWTQRELGDASGLPLEVVQNFERAKRMTTINIEAIRRAFRNAGVEFLKHG